MNSKSDTKDNELFVLNRNPVLSLEQEVLKYHFRRWKKGEALVVTYFVSDFSINDYHLIDFLT